MQMYLKNRRNIGENDKNPIFLFIKKRTSIMGGAIFSSVFVERRGERKRNIIRIK